MEIVTYDNCREELLGYASARGKLAFRKWENRPGYAEVVRFVKGFTHSYLYSVTSEEISEVISDSSHALGQIQAHEALALIEDFTTPFAFQHLFHWCLEYHRKVPTWLEFRNWIIDGPAAPHWYERLRIFLEKEGQAYTRQQWSRAAKWRLGKVYLSNIRELDLLVRTREAGLPLRYHLLADVLLRVDFWYRNVLVCVYFSNPRYRSNGAGRKIRAAEYFPPEENHFTILDVEIERQGYGNIWLGSRRRSRSSLPRSQQIFASPSPEASAKSRWNLIFHCCTTVPRPEHFAAYLARYAATSIPRA